MIRTRTCGDEHVTCRGNPEGLSAAIAPPSSASHVKAEPKAEFKAEPRAEPAEADADTVMEDVKAEPRSPPPPKRQVSNLLLLLLLLLLSHSPFTYICTSCAVRPLSKPTLFAGVGSGDCSAHSGS